MFNTILIANRGEIACRIIKTARTMGIKTVAVYSTVDKDSLHVRLADAAYCVGDAPARDSYLNIEALIDAAKRSNAQAIHPGYGFLSENPKFAQACADAGILFIGPSIAAMEAMASKQLAKQLLEKTSVPLTPGYHGLKQDEHYLLEQAQAIGFPVLIKAANGGGGKGMRAVHQEAEFSSALAGAKRESMASFADDTMIIEKLVVNPRHVELQIMADNHGNVVHLFERDCSIQRRHQKIIEEAPAPGLSPALRHNLAAAACEVARSINYTGAGTVEFLVSGNEAFYFMEMNTRLQVEHPVTELITGLDLVAWQIKIAAGESLPLSQEEIKQNGHAFECRIYAEDPYNGFIPSIGTINFLQEPCAEGIRIDTGVTLGSEITMYYDPMIAKLIVWGANRTEALQRMQHALTQYYLGGLKTNIPFLQAICRAPKFVQAELSTDFLSNERIDLAVPEMQPALIAAAAFDYLMLQADLHDPLQQDTLGWQIQGSGHWTWRYIAETEIKALRITPVDQQQFKLSIIENRDDAVKNPQNIKCNLDAAERNQGSHSSSCDNKEQLIQAAINHKQLIIESKGQKYQALIHTTQDSLTIFNDQGAVIIDRFNWNKLQRNDAKDKGQLTAPMPATVVAILKKIGESVKAGDRLIVLEAMKMEHTIHAPTDGILKDIFYTVGSQVKEGAELLSLSDVE